MTNQYLATACLTDSSVHPHTCQEQDLQLLRDLNVDVAFTPTAMYAAAGTPPLRLLYPPVKSFSRVQCRVTVYERTLGKCGALCCAEAHALSTTGLPAQAIRL